MHDPWTVAFELKYPWAKRRERLKSGRIWVYREPIVTVWHIDPETDGSDDSCDWGGYRRPLNDRERALSEALGDLFHRLGNAPYYPDPQLYGTDPHGEDPERWGVVGRAQRAMYAWRLRRLRLHPRWHIWHWHVQIHPWQKLRRWLFTRCAHCGRRFGWNEAGVTHSWESRRPVFLRFGRRKKPWGSRLGLAVLLRVKRLPTDVYHRECDRERVIERNVERVIRESLGAQEHPDG